MKKIGMKLNSLNKNLSTNKFFAGFMFLILNVGAKYATVKQPKHRPKLNYYHGTTYAKK
jgi:hypothetical protein